MEKEKKYERQLLIFYKNPELGKVKTRLAASVGEAVALAIYLKLVAHTRTITEQLNVTKTVYYSSYIDTEDAWRNDLYQKQAQRGDDLGERMAAAFEESFKHQDKHVCIIGTDCLELTSAIVSKAFQELETHDVVIGPAKDGGYYLLGMKSFHPQFFKDKNWSTSTVMHDTLQDCKDQQLTCVLLPTLNDVDTEQDLDKSLL